jgi:hypothetical protein
VFPQVSHCEPRRGEAIPPRDPGDCFGGYATSQ